MNTDLRRMFVEAEGRHLLESELSSVRGWAFGASERLAAARRLEEAEDVLVGRALIRLFEAHEAELATVKQAREKTGRDMRLALRYIALAHVRDDRVWFKRQFATWVAELLTALSDAKLVTAGYRALRDEMESRLDHVDQQAFLPYVDLFLKELDR